MIKTFLRGHPIVFINNQWVYEDTKKTNSNNMGK